MARRFEFGIRDDQGKRVEGRDRPGITKHLRLDALAFEEIKQHLGFEEVGVLAQGFHGFTGQEEEGLGLSPRRSLYPLVEDP